MSEQSIATRHTLQSLAVLRESRAWQTLAEAVRAANATAVQLSAQQARTDAGAAALRAHLAHDETTAPASGAEAIARSERQRVLRRALDLEHWHLVAARRETESARSREAEARRSWLAIRERNHALRHENDRERARARVAASRSKDRSAAALAALRANRGNS